MRISWFRGLVAAVLSLLMVACSGQTAGNGSAQGGNPSAEAGGRGRGGRGPGGGGPVPVVTTKAASRSVAVTIPAVGTAEPISAVQIRSQVTGQLSDIHFAEGQNVTKGQPLFTLDPRPFEAALQQAKAVLARDSAQAANAEAQAKRFEDLFNRGLIPRDQYETQRASLASLQATLAADQAAIDTATLNLQYSRIAAPISGRTGALNAHVGDLVRANDTTPLLVINQLSPIYVSFSVPGRYLGDIRRFQAMKPLTVEAHMQSSPAAAGAVQSSGDDTAAAAEIGRVTFIDNGVDPTTGTIRLKGSFANTHQMLWPGQFVQVNLELTTRNNAIVVPAKAVQDSQEGQFVYVVSPDRTAAVRKVQVERQQGEEVVIAQGLSAGEEVVTEGQLRLTPGAHVRTDQGGGRSAPAADGQGRQSQDAPARASQSGRGEGGA
jgi:multidrug efflux system membrane fusion protein